MDEIDDDRWVCSMCGAQDPPIFLCDAGWWCEPCFREWSGIPAEVSSDDLHDGINDGSQAGYIEVLKARVLGDSLEDLEGDEG